jgi:hypothetical protein
LARPLTLSKLKTLMEEVRVLPHRYGFPVDYRRGWKDCCEEIFRRLDTLDQGPGSQKIVENFDMSTCIDYPT